MNSISKRVAFCGILVALAFIFSYIEILIPIPIGIPGVKLGLANLVVLSSIYILRSREVLIILLARIFLTGFLFGNMSTIIYSLAGGLLSFIVMIIVKKINKFTIVGVSILGGVCHNIGQIIVAIMVVSNIKIAFYVPVLIISGSITGCVVGIIAKNLLSKLKTFLNTYTLK